MLQNSPRRLTLLIFITLFLAPAIVLAQSALCPEIVQAALAQTDDNCQATSRNQACYGNISLEAQPQEGVPDFTFSQPGDLVDIAGIQTLTLDPLDTSENLWGVALMRVQANLPDTIPGQNVTFLLFGDVEIQNAVTTNAEPITFEVTAQGNINIRSGPTTDDSVVTSLSDGDTMTANGRNAEGDWLRVELADGTTGWVFADVVATDGDITTLDLADPTSTTGPLNPMQAFYFQTGIGDAPCAEAPDSGILIQTPEGAAEINLIVNEVNIQLGSTAYIQAQPGGNLSVQTIEGLARVSAFGVTQTGLAGTIIRVPLDNDLAASGPPNPPESYDDTVLQALPIQLLEREIVIAPPLPEDKLVLGEGDIQFTLSWDNVADMDLHVIEPEGEHIFYGSRNSSIGGELDIDSNFPCGENGGSVENIYWPEGEAPSGTFQVWVDEFSPCDGGTPNWTLSVLVDGVVVYSQRGSGEGPVLDFDFSRDTLQLEYTGEGTTADFNISSGFPTDEFDADAAAEAASIEVGETVSATLADGATDYWAFQASEGQGITIVMQQDNNSGLDTYLTLYGPNGEFIASNDDFDGYNSQIGPIALTESGTYVILARGFSGAGGDYELSVNTGEVVPPFFGEIAIGDTVEHELQPNAFDTFTFEGEAGQGVQINVSSNDFGSYLDLYGPSGASLASGVSSDGVNTQLGPVALLENGTYTIVVSGYSGGGDYELSLTSAEVEPPFVGEIDFGETVQRTIQSNTRDTYTFEGEAGQGVQINLNSDDFDPYLELIGPDGITVTTNDDFNGLDSQIGPIVLPNNGTYTIIARPLSTSATGEYELTLTSAEVEPPFVGEIEYGDTVERTLQPNTRDSFTFDGEAGQSVKITLSSPDFDTYLELIGPDGQTVATNDDFDGLNSQIGPIDLPANGTYTIIARPLSTSASGDYELTLAEG